MKDRNKKLFPRIQKQKPNLRNEINHELRKSRELIMSVDAFNRLY